MTRKRILFIKHGFSETCDHRVSSVVSLGDVFRCTCLLEDFKGWEVTWVTSGPASALLEGNHLIDRLVVAETPEQLDPAVSGGRYDAVVNLEKQRDWCELSAAIDAAKRYGFRDWAAMDRECFWPESAAALARGLETDQPRPVQHTLFETLGRPWRGQRYVLGHQPRAVEMYDVGLNHHVGPKWPNKRWPDAMWQELAQSLEERGYAVCWQQALNSVQAYTHWLASCRLIVTCDSLGLHLGLALGKKMVALFGPTIAEHVYLYGQGVKLTPAVDRPCVPCMQERCMYPDCCMEHISVGMAVEAVEMLLGARGPQRRETPRPRRQRTASIGATP